MKRRNGFTLIELLAIIVILAIIAVITVPLILGIIDNAKEKAVIDSAYGYKDAVQKYYVTRLVNDTQQELPSGYKSVLSLPSDFMVSGEQPSDGWVKLNKGSVEEYSLKIGDYVVTKIVSRGTVAVKNGQIEIPDNEVLNNIAGYFSNDIDRVVYYNPIDGIKCDAIDYDSDNSTPGYKGVVPETNSLGQTKCLKWYKYSVNNDGTVNMILDHNTDVEKRYSTNSTDGPANLMDYLTLSEWKGVPSRSDKYTAYKLETNTTKTKVFTSAMSNTVNYFGKKARLITAQEVAEITGAASTTSPGISWDEQNTTSDYFYFDSNNQSASANSTSSSSYYWLFENLYYCATYGCSLTGENAYTQPGNTVGAGKNMGYWTSSPYVNASNYVWIIQNDGRLGTTNVFDSSNGVRPVITLPAASIAS